MEGAVGTRRYAGAAMSHRATSGMHQVGMFKGLDKVQVDERELDRLQAIISSMTAAERAEYKIIKASRRRRIARGSGRPVSEVNRLLKQYLQARKMMKQVKKGFLGKGLRPPGSAVSE